jgi:hypothetical protein
VRHLLEDPDAIGEMERISSSLGKPDATKKIFELVTGIMKKRGKKL